MEESKCTWRWSARHDNRNERMKRNVIRKISTEGDEYIPDVPPGNGTCRLSVTDDVVGCKEQKYSTKQFSLVRHRGEIHQPLR